MSFALRPIFFFLLLALVLTSSLIGAQESAHSSSSSSNKHTKQPAATAASAGDTGAVTGGVYRNKTLGFTCKIPEGWVLRTDEMNKREEDAHSDAAETAPASSAGAKVLLATFSRPPEARGEEVNASILIAAESAAAYPGLTDAAQYFFPLTEVAKAQGFIADEDPYEIAIGTKTLSAATFIKTWEPA
jgi:hypothetical protein